MVERRGGGLKKGERERFETDVFADDRIDRTHAQGLSPFERDVVRFYDSDLDSHPCKPGITAKS